MKKESCAERIAPIGTLSQNGYGAVVEARKYADVSTAFLHGILALDECIRHSGSPGLRSYVFNLRLVVFEDVSVAFELVSTVGVLLVFLFLSFSLSFHFRNASFPSCVFARSSILSSALFQSRHFLASPSTF